MDFNVVEVAAAFILKDNKLLVVQRSEKDTNPLKWELPGGKLKPDEKYDEALIREIKEELSIDVEVIQEVGSIEIDGKVPLVLMFLFAEGDISKIKLTHHKDFKFLKYSELKNLDLLPADKMFLEQYENEIKEYIG